MKKVWILEKFETTERVRKQVDEYREWAKQEHLTSEQVALLNSAIAKQEARLQENPEGYWYGFEGKVIYKQFCDCAKAAIRRNADGQFRVVEAQIDDNANTWVGYKNAQVNDGVLRYLMATK